MQDCKISKLKQMAIQLVDIANTARRYHDKIMERRAFALSIQIDAKIRELQHAEVEAIHKNARNALNKIEESFKNEF